MILTVAEMKNYLRVDYSDDDSLIEDLIESAESHIRDILRLDEKDDLADTYNGKIAVLYMVAYLYEHRDEADHSKMNLTLRALLFGEREAAF